MGLLGYKSGQVLGQIKARKLFHTEKTLTVPKMSPYFFHPFSINPHIRMTHP